MACFGSHLAPFWSPFSAFWGIVWLLWFYSGLPEAALGIHFECWGEFWGAFDYTLGSISVTIEAFKCKTTHQRVRQLF